MEQMPTVPTNDIETYYVSRGDGPPIVFVHGMLMSSTMWEPQMAALSDTYRAIAYGVRGHGHTGGSDRKPYSIDLFAADLDGLLEALGIDWAVICGLSMGGTVAQAFAGGHPEKVPGLVPADTFPTGPTPLTLRLALADIRFLARVDRLVNHKTLNRWQLQVGNRLRPGISADPGVVQRLVEDAPTIPHRELVKIADATARFPGSDIDLAAVTAPVLVLHGDHLPTANEKTTERLVGHLSKPEVTVHVVPGSGHASKKAVNG